MPNQINLLNNPTTSLQSACIYIWLDILGTTKYLQANKNIDNLNATIKDLEHRFQDKALNITIALIGDGLLLSFPVNSSLFGNFQETIQSIKKVQSDFILKNKQNFFLRGGIVIEKDSYVRGDNISKGLALAVNIESKFIHWPVIGTDEETLKKLEAFFGPDSKEVSNLFIHDYNAKGEELYFINFLDSILDSKNNINKFIKRINMQLENINNTKNYPIRSKYLFLLKHIAIQSGNIKYLSLENTNTINKAVL